MEFTTGFVQHEHHVAAMGAAPATGFLTL